jgi:ubiquinone/menaquinone biosynthesis C-methylase UbiE
MTSLRRATGAELMDEPDVDAITLARSLDDLRRVNRWLGGRRVVLRLLGGMLRKMPRGRCLRVLDIATGSADLPLALVDWARRHDIELRVTATDLHAQTLFHARRAVAHEPCVDVAPADAVALPYADASFDFALCATALHHFSDADARRVVREMDRVARHGWLVSDLRRSRPALLGARALAATLWRSNPVTRHDGPLSVRKAFTATELDRLAKDAGIEHARADNHVLFRVSLRVDRTGEASGPSPPVGTAKRGNHG